MPTALSLPTAHLHTIATHTGAINTLAFSHSGGTYVLTGSSDRQIHLTRAEPPKSAQTAKDSTITSTGVPDTVFYLSSSLKQNPYFPMKVPQQELKMSEHTIRTNQWHSKCN